jgi:hypothetical protein
MMQSCFNCSRCGNSVDGNDLVCKGEGDKVFSILNKKLFFSDADVKAALLASGNDCPRFSRITNSSKLKLFQHKDKVETASEYKNKLLHTHVVSPKLNIVSFKNGLGWIVASGLGGILVTLLLMGVKF